MVRNDCLPLLALILPSHAAATPQLGAAKVYKSHDADADVTVVAARIGSVDDGRVLMKISGVEHRIDRRVLLYEVQRDNAAGKRFSYRLPQLGHRHFVNEGRQTLLRGTLRSYANVYVGQRLVKVIYDKQASKTASATTLYRAYRRSQGAGVRPLAKAKQHIAAAAARVGKDCGSRAPTVHVVWAAFARRRLSPLAGAATAYLGALSELCRTDAAYRAAIAKLSAVQFRPARDGQQHRITLNGRILRVGLAKTANRALIARLWLENHL